MTTNYEINGYQGNHVLEYIARRMKAHLGTKQGIYSEK